MTQTEEDTQEVAAQTAPSSALAEPDSGATDALTGVLALDPFRDLLASDIDQGAVTASVVTIGLDGTGIINDTVGHAIGDHVLQTVAARIRTTVRDCDVVARLRGDIFGIYCPGLGTELAAEVAGRLQLAIGQPIELEEGHLAITCCAGVAEKGPDVTAHRLLVHAGISLEAAKERGAGTIAVFDEALQEHVASRRDLARELQLALAQNLLTTGLDPIISMPDGELVGHRARIRWIHPDRGEIETQEFLWLVESIGRVADIERAVIHFAVAERIAARGSKTKTAVNISAASLRDPRQIDWILAQVGTGSDVDQSLIVEVTEAALLAAGPEGRAGLDKLARNEIGIVLTEFGRSGGSLRTLHSFSFDGVELHPELFEGVAPARAKALLAAVYSSADSLGTVVIHGGVDTDQQLAEIAALDKQLGRDGFFIEGRVSRTGTR